MTKPAARIVVVFFVFLSAFAAARGSPVRSEDYSMEILVDGAPLERHAARGRTYVEAVPGREYSIRLRNNTGGRVAVALSVDGLNTIDAKTTTARTASKWILEPWQVLTLEGWQTSGSTARRFYFTTEESSYGAWLGKTGNLGVIAAAVFREKRSRPAGIQKPGRKDEEKLRAEPSMHGGPAPSSGDAAGQRASELSDDHAATGIGAEVGHEVVRVPFDAESAPAATLRIRYEYRDALVRLGVLRPVEPACDALCRRERSSGFDGMEFAPDPYR